MLGTASTLRTAALGCRSQPALLIPCTFHTNSPSSVRSTDSSSTHRRVPHLKRSLSFKRSVKPSSTSIRPASTDALSSSATADAKVYANPEILDWNSFFKLRRTRRYWQLGSSLGCGINGFIAGASILTRSDMDALVSQLPLDPFISLGLITFTCGGAGWLVGPIFGTALFNWRIGHNKKEQMGEKEIEFYKRVKKYRVDPAGGSVANPVPDYYGEKIASVAGYRQWLKDQRAFNKKRHTYV